MAERVTELYETIRTIDDKHIIMLPSHYGSIDAYGDPAEQGMTNVAFELHPYPGLFGDRPNDSHYDIHRDWLKCGQTGTAGVCDWNTRLTELATPMLMGEFQPWQGAGAGKNDLGGKIGGVGYDVNAGLAKWLVTDEHNDVFDYPARPTNLQLTLSGSNAALSWDAVTGDGITYNLYRSTQSGSKGELIAEDQTALNFSDTGLSEEETYYYAVVAKNSIAEGYTSVQANTPLLYVPVPSKIEAEKFTAMSGVQTENSGDTGGGLNVGHFEAGDFVEFKIKVESAGDYSIDYRLASQTGSSGFEVLIDDVVVDTQTIAATGGWQAYTTKTSASFALTEGNHTLRFRSIGKEWNFNWFEVEKL